MISHLDDTITTDIVVIGAGVAGLTTALGAAPRSVALLSKAPMGQGGSSIYAQGGVAAAMGDDDSPLLHAKDTLEASAGLADPDAVKLLTTEGPEQIRWLMAIGAHFDRLQNGQLSLGREGAHSRRRVLHAHGDATGAELVRALIHAVRRSSHIQVFDQSFASQLITSKGRVVGVIALHPQGKVIFHRASAVVLATGGLGRLYQWTTNPIENTADGLAMALRVGARLADVEFVQFHPTALKSNRDPLPLLTEALRGEGALLLDDQGHRFMPAIHPKAELAPRDVVARAIWQKIQSGHQVFLDARKVMKRGFPTIEQICFEAGIDPYHTLLPVSPAAHYHMGGIAVDEMGRTSIPGLWACGEVSATGVHGANRLASNSLLEALVYGARIPKTILKSLPEYPEPIRLSEQDIEPISTHPRMHGKVVQALRSLMWNSVGLIREHQGLVHALHVIERLSAHLEEGHSEAQNMLDVAQLLTHAALIRRESRGGHYRMDFPKTDPHWKVHTVLDPKSHGKDMRFATQPLHVL